jgi:GNAT superfamily N-acetyltransferase
MGDNGCSVLAFAITAWLGSSQRQVFLFVRIFYNSIMIMSKKLTIRKTTKKDSPWVVESIDACRPIMAAYDSDQWQGKEPSMKTIQKDIESKQSYLLMDEKVRLGGVTIMDHDDAYDRLIKGQWLNDESYLVLHRFFIHPDFQGKKFGKSFLMAIEALVRQQGYQNIRLDTHERNVPMRGLLSSMAYQEVGQAWLPHVGMRLVYHKVLGEKHETKK